MAEKHDCGHRLLALAISSGLAVELTVPARNHAAKRGNVNPADNNWDGLVVVHAVGGMQEWKFDIKQSGTHFLHFQYASGGPRPVNLFINDTPQEGQYLKRVTSGFFARDLSWDTFGPFGFRQGKNTIRIEVPGDSPHLAGFVVSDGRTVPDKNAFAKLLSAKRETAKPLVIVPVDRSQGRAGGTPRP